jgi:hypothetical protein
MLSEQMVQRELWTSWASMLRVYSAAHGLASAHHAVVEIGADEIILRVDTRWTRFTHSRMTTSEGASTGFTMELDGRVRIGDVTEEMDMAAEEVARGMLTGV